jgi:hypothetical protein
MEWLARVRNLKNDFARWMACLHDAALEYEKKKLCGVIDGDKLR